MDNNDKKTSFLEQVTKTVTNFLEAVKDIATTTPGVKELLGFFGISSSKGSYSLTDAKKNFENSIESKADVVSESKGLSDNLVRSNSAPALGNSQKLDFPGVNAPAKTKQEAMKVKANKVAHQAAEVQNSLKGLEGLETKAPEAKMTRSASMPNLKNEFQTKALNSHDSVGRKKQSGGKSLSM